MKCQIQIRYFLPFHQIKRIQFGMLVTATAVSINQLQDFNLLAFVVRGNRRLSNRTGSTLIFGKEEELFPDGLMRCVDGSIFINAGQLIEIVTPFFRNFVGIS